MTESNSFTPFLQTMFKDNAVLPVVSGFGSTEDACAYAGAIKAAGITNIEITLRSAGAVEQIAAIRQADPALTLGAGTVYTPQQVMACAKADVQYIVSPGFSPVLEAACIAANVAYLPGALTPTEIQTLQERGYKYLKFFPASLNGGIETMRAYASVFSQIKFCCTGGVNENNIHDYLGQDNVACVGLSALAPKNIIKEKNWPALTELAQSIIKAA